MRYYLVIRLDPAIPLELIAPRDSFQTAALKSASLSLHPLNQSVSAH
jgi:hypothetical protein